MSDINDKPEKPESNSPDWLNDRQMEMVYFIERFHAMQGEVPNDAVMDKRFDLFDGELTSFKSHPLVAKSFKHRGIRYPSPGDLLNDRQMNAIAVMTNYTDRRSDEKKLRDVGISPREWATWILDANFQDYLGERSERMFAAAQHEAHLGLIKGMRNGNVASVKLYNEMTNRHNPDADNNVNVQVLLHRFIEILQRHIKDPIILHGIAGEMMNLAARENVMVNAGPSGRVAPATFGTNIVLKGEI